MDNELLQRALKLFPPKYVHDADRPEHALDVNYMARMEYINLNRRHPEPPPDPNKELRVSMQRMYNALLDIEQLGSNSADLSPDLWKKLCRLMGDLAARGIENHPEGPCDHPEEAIRHQGLGKPAYCSECNQEL